MVRTWVDYYKYCCETTSKQAARVSVKCHEDWGQNSVKTHGTRLCLGGFVQVAGAKTELNHRPHAPQQTCSSERGQTNINNMAGVPR
jgi:hypothetical protein